MSAKRIRTASEELRSNHADDTSRLGRTLCAVADWLDEVAERQDPSNRYDRRSHSWTGSRAANLVADTYLAEEVSA